MVNNFLPPTESDIGKENAVSNVNHYPISTRQYYSSSEDSSDNECRIIPVEKDDYLETLDRKVTEVINQSRISNVGIVGSTTSEQMNRKSSMERRRHVQRTKPSPGSNKRIFMKTPSSSDNHEGHGISSSNNIHDDNISNGNVLANSNNPARISSYLPRIVRFDESNENNNRDASSDTQESSQERWSDGADAESEEGGNLDDRNIIKRRSIARRPIRSKHRRSISSIHSAASTVSSEDGNTSEYPCSSSQRSTLGSNPEYNTQQLITSFKAASIADTNSNHYTEQTSNENGNIPTSTFNSLNVQNKEEIKIESVEFGEQPSEDDETEIASQVPSLTPRQPPSLTTSHPI